MALGSSSSSGAQITGTRVGNDSSGASCVITTDSEGSRLARQSSHVQSISCAHTYFLIRCSPS